MWSIYLRNISQNGGASQDERGAAFKFIEEVHNYPALWNVSSAAYKDTKTKQKKTKDFADKPDFVQAFLFSRHRILFLLFSASSVWLFYVSATAVSQPCYKLPCVVIWPEFDMWKHEFSNFLPLFAAWRPLWSLSSHAGEVSWVRH